MPTPVRRGASPNKIAVVMLFLGLCFLGPLLVFAQECTDDRVKKGVEYYEKGLFDNAVQELRNSVRKLQGEPRTDQKSECLFQANLFIAMAYLGMNKEGQAREFFRNAARARPCKPLNPDYYPPPVIALYDSECRKAPKPPAPTLLVKSNPTGADVYVDEVKRGKAPLRIPDLAPGQHVVRIVYGNQRQEKVHTMEPGQVLEVTADFNIRGDISITSVPSGASVFIDNKPVEAKTPVILKDRVAGEYNLRISKDGFADWNQKVTVSPEEVTDVAATLKIITYPVRIDSIPGEAAVFWDDVIKGKTPLTIGDATPGKHRLGIVKEGYETVVDTILIENTGMEKTYRLPEHTGTAVIMSDPQGAEVFIGGRYAGTTPLRHRLPVKSHTVQLKKEGYVERTISFTIGPDRETTVNERLLRIDKQPPEILFQPVSSTIRENKSHLKAVVTDNQAVGEVSLMYRWQGVGEFRKAQMVSSGANHFEAVIPEQYLRKDAMIEYFLVACDLQNNCAQAGQKESPFKLKVVSIEPYTEGYVLDVDRERKIVTISLGSSDGLAREESLYIFRLGKSYNDPATGDILWIGEDLVGTIKVRDVTPKTASAEIGREFPNIPPVTKNDRVRRRPGPPTGLRSEGTFANKVLLRWSPSREPEVRGYAIYRSPSPEGQPERIGEVSGKDNAVYEDTREMRENLTYHYRIAAVNDLGAAGLLSDRCAASTKKGVAPPHPVRAQAGTFREIILTWDISRQDPDTGSYVIYRSDGDGPFREIADLRRSSDEYVDKANLLDGRTYQYKIAGRSVYGTLGDFSAPVPVKTRGGPPPPAKITVHGNMARSVRLQWEEADREVVGFVVWRKESEQGTPQQVIKLRDKYYLDSDLTDGKTYYYCVNGFYRFRGDEIHGTCSNFATADTKPRPRTPTGFTAEGGLPRKVKMKWERNPEKDITEYLIERRVEEKPTRESFSLRKFLRDLVVGPDRFRVKADSSEFTDTGLDDGAPYHYRIKAIDTHRLESDWTAEVTVKTKPTPLMPTGLKARVEGNKVVLTWNANSESDLAGYRVYLKSGFLSSSGAVATVTTTTHEVPVRDDSKLEFAVTAVDMDSLESQPAMVEIELKKGTTQTGTPQ